MTYGDQQNTNTNEPATKRRAKRRRDRNVEVWGKGSSDGAAFFVLCPWLRMLWPYRNDLQIKQTKKHTERLICMESIIFKRYAHVGSLKWWTQCITVHIYLVQCFEFNSKFDQLRKSYCVQVLNSYTFDGWKWELLLWIIFKLDYILCLPNLAHSDCVAKYYYCSYLLMERIV